MEDQYKLRMLFKAMRRTCDPYSLLTGSYDTKTWVVMDIWAKLRSTMSIAASKQWLIDHFIWGSNVIEVRVQMDAPVESIGEDWYYASHGEKLKGVDYVQQKLINTTASSMFPAILIDLGRHWIESKDDALQIEYRNELGITDSQLAIMADRKDYEFMRPIFYFRCDPWLDTVNQFTITLELLGGRWQDIGPVIL